MNFNKLYNLILQSIITQNKESRKAMVQKSENIPSSQKTKILIFLSRLNNNKAADFLCKFFCTGQLKDTEDKKIKQVLSILANKSSIDTSKIVDLNSFIKQHSAILQKVKKKASIQNLDSIPELTQKKEYRNGVVVYKIQDSKKGQAIIRKIIDIQYGEDRNPWCLIAREGFENEDYTDSWQYWCKYNAYPKHVAFQNGKIIALCANEQPENIWWNMNDDPDSELIAYNEDSSYDYITTEKYKPYTFTQKVELFFQYNEKTQRYDYKGTLQITDRDLVKGHFPVPLGVIYGDFKCYDCQKLKDLTNGPTEVKRNYFCSGCDHLTSLKGAPIKIGGIFDCADCVRLNSLEYMPEEYSEFYCDGCITLNKKEFFISNLNKNKLRYNKETDTYNYEGSIYITDEFLQNGKLPLKFHTVEGHFMFKQCKTLISLEGSPQYVYGTYDCSDSPKLESLKGAPVEVDTFMCSKCPKLKSLQGAPKYINKHFFCQYCTNLKSLKGAPQEIDGTFDCSGSTIKSLEGGPEIVKGNYSCSFCGNLKSITGIAKTIGLDLLISNSYNINRNDLVNELNNIRFGRMSKIQLDMVYNSIKSKLKDRVKKIVHIS